jgi:hypothetical protein
VGLRALFESLERTAACAEAVAHGVHSVDVVLNILTPSVILRHQPTSSPRLR